MARIAGVDIPNEKNIGISLTYIYGIGRSTAAKIVAEAGIDPLKRVCRPCCNRLQPAEPC